MRLNNSNVTLVVAHWGENQFCQHDISDTSFHHINRAKGQYSIASVSSMGKLWASILVKTVAPPITFTGGNCEAA